MAPSTASTRSGSSPRSAAGSSRRWAIPRRSSLGVVADRVGRSSIVYRVGFFQGQVDDAAAEGRAVMVYVDNTDPARPPTPLPDVVRRAAEALLR